LKSATNHTLTVVANITTKNKNKKNNMKKIKYVTLFLFIVLLIPSKSTGQIIELDTELFKVEYEKETEKYVLASLKILDFVKDEAIKNGFELKKKKLKFTIKKSNRTVLYIDKKLKGIVWEYKSLNDFLPTKQSRKKNIYGLCHEFGHLFMFNLTNNRNNWMTREHNEAWADLFGNYMVDLLYEKKGKEIWPEPYDYLKYAGFKAMKERIEKRINNSKTKKFETACLYWYELNNIIGFENFSDLFRMIDNEKVKNPNARKKYLNVLKQFKNDHEWNVWFKKYETIIISD
jgi:hypothetical protein